MWYEKGKRGESSEVRFASKAGREMTSSRLGDCREDDPGDDLLINGILGREGLAQR